MVHCHILSITIQLILNLGDGKLLCLLFVRHLIRIRILLLRKKLFLMLDAFIRLSLVYFVFRIIMSILCRFCLGCRMKRIKSIPKVVLMLSKLLFSIIIKKIRSILIIFRQTPIKNLILSFGRLISYHY